jgi:hypothetical protein
VVNLRLLRQFLVTVQAGPLLHVHQDGPIHVETSSLLAKEESAKIGTVAEPVGVELLDKSHPCSLDQISQQTVTGSKAVHDAWLQGDLCAAVEILVQ